jgi:protein-S-isoprenylcysteine O-methyltransferase Ste14
MLRARRRNLWKAWPGVVEIGEGQKINTTGPYVIVRHPMYSGAVLMFLGIPLALCSGADCLSLFP